MEDSEYKTVSSSEQKNRSKAQQADHLPGLRSDALSRLSTGTALIVGLQSHGSVAAKHLAEAGVGKILLVDEEPKALSSVYKKIESISDSEIVCKAKKIDGHDVDTLLTDCDVVIDGLTNWQEKLIFSDACMRVGTPFIHAGGSGFRYQLFSMRPARSACLRCVFPLVGIDDVPLHPPEEKSLSSVLGLVGSWQAVEAIKSIAKVGALQGNELTKIDCLSGEFETICGLDARSDCPDCGRATRR